MKRKLLAIFTSVLLLCTMLPLGAVNVLAAIYDPYLSYSIDDGEVTITGCATSVTGGLDIPSAINGYPVTSIRYNAFRDCSSLTSVRIPDGVTSIGNSAFEGCSSLTWVSIPDSVTKIDSAAFRNCSSLTGMSIPDGVTSILPNTFWHCSSLMWVIIPDSVIYICDGAFAGCSSLTSVNIPDGVTTIRIGAFQSCSSLTEVSIPDSVTYLAMSAFQSCYSLTGVSIPDGVTYIQSSTFKDCSSLTWVSIHDDVISIGGSAFDGCNRLTDVYYGGCKEDRANIGFGKDNYDLLNAKWHYAKQSPLFSTTVTHSVMDTNNGSGLAFRFELEAKDVAVQNGNLVDLTNAIVNYLGKDCKLVSMGSVITNDENIANGNLTIEQSNGQRVVDIPVVYVQEVTDTSCAFATRLINIPDDQLERTIYARPYYVVEVDGEEIVVYGDVDTASCAEYM